MDKQVNQERHQKILDLIKDFCAKKLNDEYFGLSERIVQKLGRKKSQPLATGQLQIWAASVIHALGTINFLFDRSFEPYVSIDEINNYFGTNKTTTGAKSKQIRDLLKLNIWDSEFSTKSMSNNNPFADLVMVNGLAVPLDTLPEEYQIAVCQARAEGKDISLTTR